MTTSSTLQTRCAVQGWRDRFRTAAIRQNETGQTTAEYGLVLLAAATIAMLVVAWAGGTGAISSFFDAIIEKITSLIA